VSRFQQGSLFRLERRSCPDVWVFRWYENISGKRTYKKRISGAQLTSGIAETRKRPLPLFAVLSMPMLGRRNV